MRRHGDAVREMNLIWIADCGKRNESSRLDPLEISAVISRLYAIRRALCALRVVVKSGGSREANGFLSSKGGLYYLLVGKDVHDG